MAIDSGQRVLKGFRAVVDGFLKESLKSDEFDIPNLGALCNRAPELRDGLTFLYESTLPDTGKDGPVGESMKVNQGMALDGLFYAYNLDNGEFKLYTANPIVLNSLHGGGGFNSSKTYEHNMNGIINAMRVDVKYLSPRTGVYEAKATRLTGPRVLDTEKFLFVPYYVITRLIQMLVSLLNAGRVVEIVHNADGAPHQRLVSMNPTVLSEYNHDSAFTSDLKMVDFRYTGGLYLPVVGAPSTTSGITRINFANLDRVSTVNRRSVDLEPADNNPFRMIEREIIKIFVRQVFASENDDVKPMLWDLLRKLKTDIPYDSKEYEYQRAITDMAPDTRNRLWNRLPPGLIKYGERMNSLIDRYEAVEIPETVSDLRQMLNKALYRIVVMRSAGTFFTVYATNSNSILRMAYGDNYVARYEDQGVRLRSFLYSYNRDGEKALTRPVPGGSGGGGIAEASSMTDDQGIESTSAPGDVRRGLAGYGLKDVIEDVAGNDREVLEYVLKQAEESEENHRRAPDDKLLVRALFVSAQLGDSIYRYIIPRHIYSIARVSDYTR